MHAARPSHPSPSRPCPNKGVVTPGGSGGAPGPAAAPATPQRSARSPPATPGDKTTGLCGVSRLPNSPTTTSQRQTDASAAQRRGGPLTTSDTTMSDRCFSSSSGCSGLRAVSRRHVGCLRTRTELLPLAQSGIAAAATTAAAAAAAAASAAVGLLAGRFMASGSSPMRTYLSSLVMSWRLIYLRAESNDTWRLAACTSKQARCGWAGQ